MLPNVNPGTFDAVKVGRCATYRCHTPPIVLRLHINLFYRVSQVVARLFEESAKFRFLTYRAAIFCGVAHRRSFFSCGVCKERTYLRGD